MINNCWLFPIVVFLTERALCTFLTSSVLLWPFPRSSWLVVSRALGCFVSSSLISKISFPSPVQQICNLLQCKKFTILYELACSAAQYIYMNINTREHETLPYLGKHSNSWVLHCTIHYYMTVSIWSHLDNQNKSCFHLSCCWARSTIIYSFQCSKVHI